jgi:hypothetical protein
MAVVGYYVASRAGSDAPQWLDMLEKAGVSVRDAMDPVYSDTKPRKPTGGTITFEMLPELGLALKSLCPGEVLVIPHLGHLVSPAVLNEVAAVLVRKGALLCSVADELTLDGFADIAAAKEIMKRRAGRALNDARKLARVKIGRPKRALAGARLDEALRMFADPLWTHPAAAKVLGISRATYLRRIEEITGCTEKAEALRMKNDGRWPPKRKLK